MLLLLQTSAVQFHPEPRTDTNDRLEGSVSVTVTGPMVGPACEALLTVTVYVPTPPTGKMPECAEETDSTGSGPAGCRTRIALLAKSEKKMLPMASTAMLNGYEMLAEAANPPSPE